MKTRNPMEAKETTLSTQTLEKMAEECRYCHPLTPLQCANGCNIWKFKNELRKLREKMDKTEFKNMLLNTLKNKRRLQILRILSKKALSITQLQKELKKHNYYHSQKTIITEYVEPLIAAGLIRSNASRCEATTFGREINQLFTGFEKIENALPPHSECHEEKTIEALFENPKTYKELRSLIPTKSLSRILKRLQETSLITKNIKNSYIFYFKTKRDPQQEKLSPTEKRVYENIPEEGIVPKKLADTTGISLRRTYKYLRKLRGKKLAFKRRRPRTYTLTVEGRKVAKLLENMQLLLMEFAQASVEFTAKPLELTQQPLVQGLPKNRREKPLRILVKSNISHNF